MHLIGAPALASLILVEPGEIAIVALVQGLVPERFDVALAKFGEHQIERMLGALEGAREGDVEPVSRLFEFSASRLGFLHPQRTEIRVLPAGKQVLEVPIALSVTDEHQISCHPNPTAHSRSPSTSAMLYRPGCLSFAQSAANPMLPLRLAPVWPSRTRTESALRLRPRPSAAASPRSSAVPEGASTFCRWCISRISMSKSSPSRAAVFLTSAAMSVTPRL